MQIGVIGINHKLAPVALRETIAKACVRRFSLQNPLENASFVLLSTCNRSELYYHSPSLGISHEQIMAIFKEEIDDDFEQKLYTFFGYDCFLHLAKVTAGLDSAIVAETEIQGQVKTAYEAAAATQKLSKDLHFLFQKSLKIAKEVRQHHLATYQLPDLEHALFWYIKEFFEDELPTPLFIGTSEINLKIARFFQQKGMQSIHIANRTDNHHAKEMELEALAWTNLQQKWQDYPLVIAATKSPHYILQKRPLTNCKTLLVDLAVPRNIDPELESAHCKVVNIDDLNQLLEKRKALLQQQISLANIHLTQGVKRSLALFRTKNAILPMAISA
ncbi:MAG: glutamyl-tRNA reductase [Verrucomicrobia bacterium]|nr:glutamyl-tRNA reductase [Verrucomicrobiota bacterium]MBS0635924.1 glutamyl-tRNA reductase [Verrucomicrobiota bacterium]